MAPDFIRESMSEEFLEILEPSRIFPVSVNLYTREEYDELLKKQVEKRCAGCRRYGGNSEDLTGHHREISLAGVCYSREDETDIPSFSRFAEWLWEVLAEETNELASLIDKGEQKKFSEKINSRLKNLSGSKQLFLSGLAAGIENACGYGESGGFSPVGGRLDGISLFSERDL